MLSTRWPILSSGAEAARYLSGMMRQVAGGMHRAQTGCTHDRTFTLLSPAPKHPRAVVSLLRSRVQGVLELEGTKWMACLHSGLPSAQGYFPVVPSQLLRPDAVLCGIEWGHVSGLTAQAAGGRGSGLMPAGSWHPDLPERVAIGEVPRTRRRLPFARHPISNSLSLRLQEFTLHRSVRATRLRNELSTRELHCRCGPLHVRAR